MVIGEKGPIGRIELSKKVGLGEGATRTIIKHLTAGGFVESAKEGCLLTQRGMSLYKSLHSKLSEIHSVNARQFALDRASAGVLIRNAGTGVRRGIEQRDAAIVAGASGACTLVYRNDKFVMPMGEGEEWSLGSQDLLYKDLKELFMPNEDDVITLVSAANAGLAEHCAMAAALTLLG